MRRAPAAGVAAVITVLVGVALTGCGSSDEPSDSGTPAAESSAAPKTPSSDAAGGASEDMEPVSVEIKGDEVEPNGRRLQVEAGQPIRLHIESDRPAELHVHSSPEQEVEVKKGESMVSFTVDTPGIVEVEEHESGMVILQLEVR